MRRAMCLWTASFLILSFVSTSFAADRTYRGVIKYIGYDLKENRMRVDVFDEKTGQNVGRGTLYFENKASQDLAEMIQRAFVHNTKVEVWVHVTDDRGRANVIYTVNFSKVP